MKRNLVGGKEDENLGWMTWPRKIWLVPKEGGEMVTPYTKKHLRYSNVGVGHGAAEAT